MTPYELTPVPKNKPYSLHCGRMVGLTLFSGICFVFYFLRKQLDFLKNTFPSKVTWKRLTERKKNTPNLR